MLNRRILRIKAFQVLYAAAETPGMSEKEALSILEASCEATRDLYLYMLSIVSPLTAEAKKRIQAAKGKFHPTEEELHPNTKFADNALAPLLENDPDFSKLLEKKKFGWDPPRSAPSPPTPSCSSTSSKRCSRTMRRSGTSSRT